MADSKGMVDIAGKEITVRTAKAVGSIRLGPEAFDALQRGTCPKGDVLATAKVAAIQAVKSTSDDHPDVPSDPRRRRSTWISRWTKRSTSVGVTVAVKSSGKTGVEMEALHGVAAACLTIYDMLKYTGKGMTIERIQLLEKTGGRSGDYKRHGLKRYRSRRARAWRSRTCPRPSCGRISASSATPTRAAALGR